MFEAIVIFRDSAARLNEKYAYPSRSGRVGNFLRIVYRYAAPRRIGNSIRVGQQKKVPISARIDSDRYNFRWVL